jgi:hypothetical protein
MTKKTTPELIWIIKKINRLKKRKPGKKESQTSKKHKI